MYDGMVSLVKRWIRTLFKISTKDMSLIVVAKDNNMNLRSNTQLCLLDFIQTENRDFTVSS